MCTTPPLRGYFIFPGCSPGQWGPSPPPLRVKPTSLVSHLCGFCTFPLHFFTNTPQVRLNLTPRFSRLVSDLKPAPFFPTVFPPFTGSPFWVSVPNFPFSLSLNPNPLCSIFHTFSLHVPVHHLYTPLVFSSYLFSSFSTFFLYPSYVIRCDPNLRIHVTKESRSVYRGDN